MNTCTPTHPRPPKGFSLVGFICILLFVAAVAAIIVILLASRSQQMERVEGIREAYFRSTGAN